MTSVLPPSASEDDDTYAFNRKEPVAQEHEQYVATPRRNSVPVLVAIVVAALVILGTVLVVMLVWGGRLL